MQPKRYPYLTQNRIKIIDFCKNNDGNITKAQIMELLNCSDNAAYECSKSMIDAGILQKRVRCKFKLVDFIFHNNKT